MHGNPARRLDRDQAGGTPLISVVIRTRNRPRLLRQALASVAAQSWRRFEVVVVNDGGESVDAILAEVENRVTLRLVVNAECLGRSAAGNRGVAAATGRFIAFLDDDDLFHPSHLERLAEDLLRDEPAVVYSDCDSGAFERIGERVFTVAEPEPYPIRDFDADWLHVRNYIPLDSALFSRDLWLEVGGFDEDLEALEDWDLWLRMSARVPFRRVPGVSVTVRVFADHEHDFIAAMTRVYDKHREYWTPTNLAERIWPRVQRLEAAARSAERPLASSRGAAVRFLLRLTPYRLKHWLNLRLQTYRRW